MSKPLPKSITNVLNKNRMGIPPLSYEVIPVSEDVYKATKLGVMFQNGVVVEGSYDADEDQHLLIIKKGGK
tara:strand:+ start:4218 stop:4430 length:213 start_codon:yes stop_codon:yes gene_type:complete